MFINVEDQERAAKVTSNYKKWIFHTIKDFLGQRIIEVGCGIGTMTPFWGERNLVVALDSDASCIEVMKDKFKDYSNVVAVKMDILDEHIVEQLYRYNFDTVICLNVLEHIKDDQQAIQNMYGLLSAGGKLILFVPAYPFLFGIGDITVGHYRRYAKKVLEEKLKYAGFNIEQSFFMHITGIIGWFLHSKVVRKREGFFEDSLYDRLVIPWISRIEEVIRFPFGLSIVCICNR